jgi:hypothetical protein
VADNRVRHGADSVHSWNWTLIRRHFRWECEWEWKRKDMEEQRRGEISISK